MKPTRRDGTRDEPAAVVVRPRDTRRASSATGEDPVVDSLVAFIRARTWQGFLAAQVDIGGEVLDRLFGGDVELARSKNPDKAAALQRLLDRSDEMGTTPAALRRAIGVAIQYRGLPVDLRDRLSVRHHYALLPLDHPAKKAKLAREAVEKKLPALEVARRARAAAPPRAPAEGRPAKWEVEKAVGAAHRSLLNAVIEAEIAWPRRKKIPPETRRRILDQLRTLRERLERITDALQGD